MTSVDCPNCRGPMLFDPSLVGQAVACPHCSYQFVMPSPKGATVVTTVSAIAPAVAAVPSRSFTAVAATRFKPSTSLMDAFFDFKFERYVTPRIVRATWGAAVFMAVAGILFYGFMALSVWLPKPRARVESTDVTTHVTINTELLESALPGPDVLVKLAMSFRFLAEAVGIAVALLWIRVALEAVIVVFQTAESVASIDKKTKS